MSYTPGTGVCKGPPHVTCPGQPFCSLALKPLLPCDARLQPQRSSRRPPGRATLRVGQPTALNSSASTPYRSQALLTSHWYPVHMHPRPASLTSLPVSHLPSAARVRCVGVCGGGWGWNIQNTKFTIFTIFKCKVHCIKYTHTVVCPSPPSSPELFIFPK